jgi:formiminotetrahydrofolate cyclodeaminase
MVIACRRRALPQLVAAVRAQSPATAAGGEGVDALAAAVGAALQLLVAAASEHADVSH